MRALILLLFAGVAFAAPPKGIQLSWTASSSCVVATGNGYNVYRGTTTGGPYTLQVGPSLPVPCSATTFQDPASGLVSGTKYFYVVTTAAGGVESVYSNEASVTFQVPIPPASLSVTQN